MDNSNDLNATEFKTTKVFKTIEPYIDIGTLLVEDLDPFSNDNYR